MLATLAPPFDAIFQDETEAHWGFDFLCHTLELLGASTNDYRPVVLTLPKHYRLRLLRFNFGPWLLVDFSGPTAQYGKCINLALLKDDRAVDPRQHWFRFNHPHDHRGVSIYKFTWEEIKEMDAGLREHYEESIYYTGSLFSGWRGSPYRLAHQPQILAALFNPAARADLLEHGLDPLYAHKVRSAGEE